MRSLIVICLLAAAADAQPGTSTCEVDVVTAPDRVRAAIASAMATERCTVPLEVRAVVTVEGGIYVIARDPSGRVRERIVPDARGVAVLVAAWATESATAPTAPTAPSAPSAPSAPYAPGAPSAPYAPGAPIAPNAPAAPDAPDAPYALGANAPYAGAPTTTPFAPNAPTGPAYSPTFAPPSLAQPNGPTDTAPAVRVVAPARTKLITLAGLLGKGRGVRASIDVWSHGRSAIGVSSALTADRLFSNYGPYGFDVIDVLDWRSVAYASHTWGGGPWKLRGSVGAGLVVTRASRDDIFEPGAFQPNGEASGTAVFPIADALFVGGRDFGRGWGFDAGILLSAYEQQIHYAAAQMDEVFERTGVELLLVAGLRKAM